MVQAPHFHIMNTHSEHSFRLSRRDKRANQNVVFSTGVEESPPACTENRTWPLTFVRGIKAGFFKVWRYKLFPSLAMLLLLWIGCTPSQQSVNTDEPPLKPVSGTGQQPDLEQSGRQTASFKLTEEGRDYLRSGRLDEARSKFEKALSLSSSNPYAYFYLGEVRYLKQEYQKSLPLLERAELFLLKDSVWLSRVHVLRGKNYEALSLFDEARGQYQQALAEDPSNPEAQEGMLRLQNSGEIR